LFERDQGNPPGHPGIAPGNLDSAIINFRAPGG
jgi:hypothetical protein